MVLYYTVLRHFAAIQTVGGKSKRAKVTSFASTSPVSIWKKALTVASTTSLCLTAVHFVPSINISLLSWQAGVLRMLVVVMAVVWCGGGGGGVIRECLVGTERKDGMVQCMLYTS